MPATTQELRDRVKASGRIPYYGQLAHHGLAVCVAAIVIQDLDEGMLALLESGAYTPAEIEGIASAALVLEHRVNQALERAGKETCRT